MKKTNSAVLLIIWILDAFMVIGYIIEYLKGMKPIEYIIIFLAILLIPMITATIIYKRQPESKLVKYITLVGYFILYIFAMFSAERLIIFIYIFPIISMYLLYFNLKLIITSCGIIFTINITRIIYQLAALKINSPDDITDFSIQFCAVVLFSTSLIICTYHSNRNNSEKMRGIEQERENESRLTREIINTAAVLNENSTKLFDLAQKLEMKSEAVVKAVNEISAGAVSNAESMQAQSALTQSIQNLIVETSALSEKMIGISLETSDKTKNGISVVETLDEKSQFICSCNDTVYMAIEKLKEKSAHIHDIVDVIGGIAHQTNLLALNASIEAARAGEAGREFAVVAESVRKLAEESKASVADISEKLGELLEDLNVSVNAVSQLIQTNTEQNALVSETRQVFENISASIHSLENATDSLNGKVQEVQNANSQIVLSINEISAISQETVANAEEAESMTNENLFETNAVKNVISELVAVSKTLEKYE